LQERTQNLSEQVLTKTPNANEVRRCTSTCVVQTPAMPARTQNVSQHVLNKPLHCKGEHKMSLN
jgi:hypothetical protein